MSDREDTLLDRIRKLDLSGADLSTLRKYRDNLKIEFGELAMSTSIEHIQDKAGELRGKIRLLNDLLWE